MESPTVSLDRRGRPRRLRAAVAVLVAVLALAACGSDSDSADDNAKDTDSGTTQTTAKDEGGESVLGPVDAAKGEPVKVGFITDGKNPSTDQSVELDVTDAVVKYLNEHKGGIGGRPIEVTTCEAKLDAAKGADCSNQMIEQGVAAVVVGTTGVTEAVWQPLNDAKVPAFFYAAGGQKIGNSPTSFILADPTASVVAMPAGVAKKEKKKKVTAIVIDVPAALTSYVGPEADKIWGKDGNPTLDLIRIAPGTADMTPQLQKLASGDPGIVHVLGNDSFCISAFQALIALNVEAPVTSIGPCITDATRKAIPGDFFDGVTITTQATIGDEGEGTALIRAVEEEYASKPFDLSRTAPFGTFTAWTAFQAATADIQGEITPESILAAIKAAPEQEIPGSGGLKFRCNGKAHPTTPASCVRGTLVTVLDETGNPTTYDVLGATPIPD